MFFGKLFRWVILFAVIFNVVNFYLRWKTFSISAKDFKQAATKSIDQNALSAVSKLTSELRSIYKTRIPYDLHWVPLSGGGLQLRAQFLFADFTEYIAILAAGSDTVGRSGIHWSNSTCTVLTGEVSRTSDAMNGIVKETFVPGNQFRHGQFESYIYQVKEGTHVACYGRGFIPVSGIWTTLGSISNGDPLAIAKLGYSYGKIVIDNIAYTASHLFQHYKEKIAKFEL